MYKYYLHKRKLNVFKMVLKCYSRNIFLLQRTYDLKWKLWNEYEQECCFMFPIKLVK